MICVADEAADGIYPCYCGGVGDVFYYGIITHYSSDCRADVALSGYRAGVESEVPYVRAFADGPEEPHVVLARPVYRKAEYAVAEAVEASGELSACRAADRVESSAVVIVRRRVRVYRVAQGVASAQVRVHRLELFGVFDPHVALHAV